MYKSILSVVFVVVFSILGCQTGKIKTSTTTDLPVDLPVEFRGAWVASVANINWPSQPGLTPQTQRQEAFQLLNLLDSLHFNAVILQVRPQCDALYPSKLEPWSYYLTGEVGTPPTPMYDPLQFWIEACHTRGLELHAWLNPYRAHHTAGGAISEKSIVHKSRHLVHPLSNGMWWMDPSLTATQDHSYAVVMDLVRRYDLDGIHFDDYFYPYPSYNDGNDFPDSVNYQNYLKEGGNLTVNDFRRKSVNDFIQRVYQGIKSEKDHVKFGISPFGIWRPGNPSSITGFDQYDQLYADAKLWLEKGWVDYFTPQLYWPINQIAQSYPVLLKWWQEQNKKQRPLWPGMSIGRKQGAEGADEVLNQIMITRALSSPLQSGTVHWSIAPLQTNDTLTNSLINSVYAKPALVPPMRHLSRKKPSSPKLLMTTQGDSITCSWEAMKYYSAFISEITYSNQRSTSILSRTTNNLNIAKQDSLGNKLQVFKLWGVDRYGSISSPATWSALAN